MHRYFTLSFSTKIFFLSIAVSTIVGGSIPHSAFAHTSIPSSPTTACVSLDSTDLTTHTSNQIDSRIVGKSPSTDYKLFSTTGTTASTTWVRNAGVWTNTGVDLDWTGISPWNSQEANRRAATLISPRHVMMASHYIINPGSKLTFIDNNNVAYERTVTAVSSVANTDVSIGLLDSDVPDTVTYYPIMSVTNIEATLKKYSPMVYDVPFIAFDQDKNAIIQSFHNIASSFIFHHPYTSGSRATFSQDIVGGDSGNPSFIIIDNQPVLLFGHESGGAGPNYGSYISSINTVMSLLGGGYQVTEYSPTCFNSYTPNSYPSFTNTNATTTFVHYSGSTPILTYTATDADVGQTLRFSIKGLYSATNPNLSLNASDYFSLSSTTGVLTQTADINNNTLGNTLYLAVTINDNGTNIATTSATTTINISYPVLSSAIVLSSTIELDFDRTIATSSIPSTSDFAVKVNGVSRSVSSVSMLDDKVRLTLSSAVASGEVTTLTYTPGTNKLMDLNGSYASAISSELTIPVSTDGTLDTSFDPGVSFDGTVTRTLLQPDGKLIVFGGFFNYQNVSSIFIARLNTDGSLDTSFHSGFDISHGVVSAVVIQPDGKIIVGGNMWMFNATSSSSMLRLNSDGSLDNTFNNPFSYINSDSNEVKSMVLQPDGKIIATYAGNATYPDNSNATGKVYRFNTDGTRDVTFSAGATGPNSTNNSRLVLQPDGKVIMTGAFTNVNGTSRNRVTRFNTDGSLDVSFSIGTGFSASTSTISSVAIQPDGKILLAGSFALYNGTARNKILRLNSDGSLDTNFNTTGAGLGASTSSVSGIVLQDDGKIILSGSFTTYNGITKNRLLRLNSDGTLDTTFDTISGPDTTAGVITADSYGDIYAIGAFTSYNGTPRLRIAKINASTTADVSAPSITNITTTNASGSYKIGDTITLQVVFDEAVAVNTTGGTPTLSLETGDNISNATYVSGNGTNTLLFTYTIQSGDFSADLDYASTTALSLNGGTITDASLSSGYNATLTLPEPGSTGSLSKNATIVVDGLAPEIFIASINGSTLDLIYSLGYSENLSSTDLLDTSSIPAASSFTVRYDSLTIPVSSVSVSDYSVKLTMSTVAEAGRQVTVSYNPVPPTIKDLAGNTASSLTNYAVNNNTEEVVTTSTSQTQITYYPTGATSGGGSSVSSQIVYGPQKSNTDTSGVTPPSSQSTTTGTPYVLISMPSNFTFNKNFDSGTSHLDIKILQRFLNQNGYTVSLKGAGSYGKETATFGPATKNALIKFQKAMGIKPASGYFGPITRGVLNNILKKTSK